MCFDDEAINAKLRRSGMELKRNLHHWLVSCELTSLILNKDFC